MSKKKIKPKKFLFFATFFYGLLFWILLPATLLSVILSIDPSQKNWGAAIATTIVLALATIGFGVLRNIRRKSLSLRLPITPNDIPYTADELKHYVGLQENDAFADEYCDMCDAYRTMKKSKMVQIILSTDKNTELRSSVKNYITTAETKLEMRNCPALYLKQEVPILIGCDRTTYYLYPHFVLRVAGKKDITAFSYAEFELGLTEGSYILGKEEKVPRDAEVIGEAYKHANKDGSPDMRVKDNPSTPIIKTADIESDDYDIHYQLSNYDAAEEFYNKFDIFAEKAIQTENVKARATAQIVETEVKEDVAIEIEEGDKKQSKGENKKGAKKAVTPKDPYKELASLIGLDSVKGEVKTLANLVQVQQAREKEGLKNAAMSYHLVFTGSPGTGKTTIARIIAAIYRDLGILKKGHLVETDRSGLVAGYLGQTAIKTNSVVDEALDGVLFIDEAYSLSEDQDAYGKEAIATLLKRMEDDRDRLVVILAGYTDEMKRFISTNPGLESRFNRYIDFPDYSEDELLEIFMKQVEKFEYVIDEKALEIVKDAIHENFIKKDNQFGNARFVRNLFEKILANQANRLAKEDGLNANKLRLITEVDCIL